MNSFVCRVCLKSNFRTIQIQDTKLLEIFQKLAGITSVNIPGGRSITMCYICLSQLQRSSRLTDMAQQSARARTYQQHNSFEVAASNATAQNMNGSHHLRWTAIEHMTVIEQTISTSFQVKVKLEQVDIKEEIDEVMVFIENLKEETADGISNIEEITLDHDGDSVGSCNKKQPILRNSYVYCDQCNKKFGRKSKLEVHLRTHTGDKPFACKTCNKAYSQSNDLKRHMVIHTGKKTFVCKSCNKKFGRKCTMQKHMMTHTGEKPHVCILCDSAFACDTTLRRHILIHTRIKAYACKNCTKVFDRAGSLKRHMRKHTGEKPYVCSICSKAYTRSYTLKKHMLSHAGESML